MGIEGLAGRPWLLLPGTLCTGAMFDGLMGALGVQPAQRTHVKINRPSIEDYGATFENLPADTIVCGFSLGAIVAAHYADRMTAGQLVLFGVNPFADAPPQGQSRRELAADVKALGGAAALQRRPLEVHGQAPNETRSLIYAMADTSADQIDAQTTLALTRPGALPALTKATKPVFCLTGSQDTSAPVVKGLAAAQAAPNGQFHILDGLGHFALLEDPEACAVALGYLMETHYGTA